VLAVLAVLAALAALAQAPTERPTSPDSSDVAAWRAVIAAGDEAIQVMLVHRVAMPRSASRPALSAGVAERSAGAASGTPFEGGGSKVLDGASVEDGP
jgi:hypothetical protein